MATLHSEEVLASEKHSKWLCKNVRSSVTFIFNLKCIGPKFMHETTHDISHWDFIKQVDISL